MDAILVGSWQRALADADGGFRICTRYELLCFMIEFDTHDVLCLVSTIVSYSACFISCIKISFDI